MCGESFGGALSMSFALAHPERVRSVVFGGLGSHMVRGMVGSGPLAKALEAPRLVEGARAGKIQVDATLGGRVDALRGHKQAEAGQCNAVVQQLVHIYRRANLNQRSADDRPEVFETRPAPIQPERVREIQKQSDRELIDAIKDGSALWIYYPDEEWLEDSEFLDEE